MSATPTLSAIAPSGGLCDCPSEGHLPGCSTGLDDGDRHLSGPLRETLADQVLLGFGAVELSELHGVDIQRMRQWLQSDGIKARVEDRRARVTAQASRAYFRFLMVADDLARAQVADALDPSSPNNYKARTYILDRVLPARTAVGGETTLNIQINNQVLGQLVDAVEGAQAARQGGTSGQPQLLPGKKALPPIGDSGE